MSRPRRTEEEAVLRQMIVDELRKVAMLKGEFKESPESYAIFDPWYQKMKEAEDTRLGGYVARKGDHATKLAMVLSASRSNDMIISGRDMERAIHMLEVPRGSHEACVPWCHPFKGDEVQRLYTPAP